MADAATDEVRPALTAAEWRGNTLVRADARRPGWAVAVERDAGGRELFVRYAADRHGTDAIPLPPDALPAVIALANAALPDGDPRKITRADVDVLRTAYLDTLGVSDDEPSLKPLIAKLAALLPPE